MIPTTLSFLAAQSGTGSSAGYSISIREFVGARAACPAGVVIRSLAGFMCKRSHGGFVLDVVKPIVRFVADWAPATAHTKGLRSLVLNAITLSFLWEVLGPEGLEPSTKGL